MNKLMTLAFIYIHLELITSLFGQPTEVEAMIHREDRPVITKLKKSTK